MFARAIVIDPQYARAYAGVADCCSFLYMYWDSTEDNLNEAEAASRKALELDPELAEAHAAGGIALALKKSSTKRKRNLKRLSGWIPSSTKRITFTRARLSSAELGESRPIYEKASSLNQTTIRPSACWWAFTTGSGVKRRRKPRNSARFN